MAMSLKFGDRQPHYFEDMWLYSSKQEYYKEKLNIDYNKELNAAMIETNSNIIQKKEIINSIDCLIIL